MIKSGASLSAKHSEADSKTNQAKPLANYNMFASNPVLVQLVKSHGGNWGVPKLEEFGAFLGSLEADELAIQANRNEPELHTHDRFGNRHDFVDFHPAYHALMEASMKYGVHNLPWVDPRAGAHLVRAALMFMAFQNEAGHCCPMSMTYACVPALRLQPDLAEIWMPKICSNNYDKRFLPAKHKNSVTLGMGMTERQGGSDVRANITTAVAKGQPGPGQEYMINGHKWFLSAPMSDAFLVLAKIGTDLSCFLVPRWKPDETKNGIIINRLKDKLGNRSNASSEVEFVDALGWLVGVEGRGVATIIEMVNHTRLDCMLGAAGLMEQSKLQAMHHSNFRGAWGKMLIEHPLQLNVLADLALESEAALRLSMRVAAAFDRSATESGEANFKRIATAVGKYWICERAPVHVAAALACFGGNGYVEEGPMPRLFRESPLLGIWEGSSNVICLDVLRAIRTDPDSLDAFLAELELELELPPRTVDPFELFKAFELYVAALRKDLVALSADAKSKQPEVMARCEVSMRSVVERMAIALQSSLMVRQAPQFVADAFIASRIAHLGGRAFGTLPELADVKAIVERAYQLVSLT